MITDNGIEYEYTKEIVSDEKQIKIVATEYYDMNDIMVRRDVKAIVKEGHAVFDKVGE